MTFETYEGKPQFIDWVIQGDKLTFDSSDDISSNLTRSTDNPESILLCSDSTDQGLINTSINFQALPQALHFEEYYNLHLLFDLNENDIEDTGDISFLFHKSRDSDTTNISSLFPHVSFKKQ